MLLPVKMLCDELEKFDTTHKDFCGVANDVVFIKVETKKQMYNGN